jgi:hypothetical protein
MFGEEAAEGLRAPYYLGDTQLLSSLFNEAGLPDAHIHTQDGTARFPSIQSWMYTDINGWVLVNTLSDEQFQHLVAIVEQELQSCVTTDGSVAFSAPAHIITAVKAA